MQRGGRSHCRTSMGRGRFPVNCKKFFGKARISERGGGHGPRGVVPAVYKILRGIGDARVIGGWGGTRARGHGGSGPHGGRRILGSGGRGINPEIIAP